MGNNKALWCISALVVLTVFSRCNSGGGVKESIRFNPSAVIIKDTIPSTFKKIPGEYILNFSRQLFDTSKKFKELFQLESASKNSIVRYFNDRFRNLNLGSEQILSINRYRAILQLSQLQIAKVATESFNKYITNDYEIKTFSNMVAPIDLPDEEISWGTTRVSKGARENKEYSQRVWIVDSGIDPNQQDLNVDKKLSTSFYPNTHYYDVDGPGNDHGTQVAGIIGAIVNQKGIIGTAPNALLVAVKYIHNDNFKYRYYLDALSYVEDNAKKGDVLNLSVQNTPGENSEIELIQRIAAKGVKVVIAAGNYRRDVDFSNIYPAKINGNNIYTVSAFSEGDLFFEESNYGSSIDISAPGKLILTTLPHNKYGYNDGTSFAAPYVSAILFMEGKFGTDGTVRNGPDSQADSIVHE